MTYERIAEHLVDEWKLANDYTPVDILQAHFASMCRISKTASDCREYAEARVMVAGVTIDFIQEVAEAIGASIGSVMELLKDSKVVRFFSKIGWSFRKLWDILKKGYHAYVELRRVIAEYLANTRVGRWTTEELKKLDEFLKKHPVASRISGPIVGAILVYIWFNEAYTGDPVYDFDTSEIINALSGRFSLADIFGGSNGAVTLMGLVVGGAISFPWPGPTTVHFISAIIMTLAKKLHVRLQAA